MGYSWDSDTDEYNIDYKSLGESDEKDVIETGMDDSTFTIVSNDINEVQIMNEFQINTFRSKH